MKKKVITYFTVGILLFLAVIGIVSDMQKNSRSGKPKGNSQENQQGAASDPIDVIFSDKDSVNISGVKVINFTKGAETITEKKLIRIDKKEAYDVIYHADSGLFLISILSSPFTEQRILAEIDFINQLGIERKEACRLNVSITTPYAVNQNEAGRNYKLSFCE